MATTMTRRTLRASTPSDAPMLDLGNGVVVPKNTTVRAVAINGDQLVGPLCAVNMRGGIPHTVDVWCGDGMRFAYVETVVVQ
jgi:hypothetical protein